VRDPLASLRAYNQEVGKTESPFERDVLKRLTAAGYRVKSQWQVGYFRIDMVIEGAGKRLAVECDGDRYHPLEKLAEDMERQSILERLGWQFVRIRGSAFFRNPELAMRPVFARLNELGIAPEAENVAQPQSDMDLIHELDDLIRMDFAAAKSVLETRHDGTLHRRQSRLQSRNPIQRPSPTRLPARIRLSMTNKLRLSSSAGVAPLRWQTLCVILPKPRDFAVWVKMYGSISNRCLAASRARAKFLSRTVLFDGGEAGQGCKIVCAGRARGLRHRRDNNPGAVTSRL